MGDFWGFFPGGFQRFISPAKPTRADLQVLPFPPSGFLQRCSLRGVRARTATPDKPNAHNTFGRFPYSVPREGDTSQYFPLGGGGQIKNSPHLGRAEMYVVPLPGTEDIELLPLSLGGGKRNLSPPRDRDRQEQSPPGRGEERRNLSVPGEGDTYTPVFPLEGQESRAVSTWEERTTRVLPGRKTRNERGLQLPTNPTHTYVGWWESLHWEDRDVCVCVPGR